MRHAYKVLLLVFVMNAQFLWPQPVAFFTPGLFFTHANGAFFETNLTLSGITLKHHTEEGRLRSSVNITTRIFKDSVMVKAERYNLHGPFFSDSLAKPSFIDCQRYFLPNGSYRLEMQIIDNNAPSAKQLSISHSFIVNFDPNNIETSLIQPLESFKKAVVKGPLTKNGYDLVPYNSNFYPESTRDLAFYLEAYNCDKILGLNNPLVFEWYLETAADSARLSSYGSFQKDKAGPVNAMLAKSDISKLKTGNYALVLEVKDRENKVRRKEKYFFKRLNRLTDPAVKEALDEKALQAMYVGSTDNADTLQTYVECLWPIAGNDDKKKIVDVAVNKDPESMKRYIVDFWQRRAADTADPLQMWAAYYQRVQQAMQLFKCGKQKGYYTERGRVFLQYGSPNQRTAEFNEPNTFPYEIWQYYRITDGTNGHFFSNRKFVFVNKNIGDDCHVLVHSDMRGEINNPRWQYEVTRRNFEGIGNPDNNTPGNTEHNQFRQIFENPR